ncbi:hypothetical protein GGR57DRAFT_501366 [Xylariaceae sp. FL1272]|nr:hypothetical protein GGR57DRAFT_501366 [Xylariaceae sp. FL1272]
MNNSGGFSGWAPVQTSTNYGQQSSVTPLRTKSTNTRDQQPSKAPYQQTTTSSANAPQQLTMASFQLCASATYQPTAAGVSRFNDNTRPSQSANAAQKHNGHHLADPAGVKKHRKRNSSYEDGPKQVANPFIRYRSSQCGALHASNPGMSAGDVSLAIAHQWKNMTDAEKKPYRDEYEEAQRAEYARFAAEMGRQINEYVGDHMA